MRRFGLGEKIKIVLSVLLSPRTFALTDYAKDNVYAQRWLSARCWEMAMRFSKKKRDL